METRKEEIEKLQSYLKKGNDLEKKAAKKRIAILSGQQPKKKTRFEIFAWIIFIVVISVFLFALALNIFWSPSTSVKKVQNEAQKIVQPEVKKEAVAHSQGATDAKNTQTKNNEQAKAEALKLLKSLQLGMPKKGEGPEHGIIRTLRADPLVAKYSKYAFKGDIKDQLAVKKWAQRTAHLIAIDAGYINPKTGAEIRVRTANYVSIHLEKEGDSGLKINEYTKGNTGNFQIARTLKINTANTQFQGRLLSDVPPYEYVFNLKP